MFKHFQNPVYLVFGEMTFCFIQFRQNDVRANDVTGKRRSTERRFVKMTFGWTTIRENDVRLNNDSEKCLSALWSFANSTIRPCDDSVKWLSAIFFRQNNDLVKLHFGKMTNRWNDVSGKWYGPLAYTSRAMSRLIWIIDKKPYSCDSKDVTIWKCLRIGNIFMNDQTPEQNLFGSEGALLVSDLPYRDVNRADWWPRSVSGATYVTHISDNPDRVSFDHILSER